VATAQKASIEAAMMAKALASLTGGSPVPPAAAPPAAVAGALAAFGGGASKSSSLLGAVVRSAAGRHPAVRQQFLSLKRNRDVDLPPSRLFGRKIPFSFKKKKI
jgi:hypothetical protein